MAAKAMGTYLYYEFSKYGGLVITIFTDALLSDDRITAFAEVDTCQFYDWLFERPRPEPITTEHFISGATGLQDAAGKLWEITTEQFMSRPWDRTKEL